MEESTCKHDQKFAKRKKHVVVAMVCANKNCKKEFPVTDGKVPAGPRKSFLRK